MICQSCNNQILFHVQNVCPKCGGMVELPKKKKLGRPVTKTPEERKSKDKEWLKNNAEHRRAYIREYSRDKRNSKQGRFVVEHEGLYRRSDNDKEKRWSHKSIAKVYS